MNYEDLANDDELIYHALTMIDEAVGRDFEEMFGEAFRVDDLGNDEPFKVELCKFLARLASDLNLEFNSDVTLLSIDEINHLITQLLRLERRKKAYKEDLRKKFGKHGMRKKARTTALLCLLSSTWILAHLIFAVCKIQKRLNL